MRCLSALQFRGTSWTFITFQKKSSLQSNAVKPAAQHWTEADFDFTLLYRGFPRRLYLLYAQNWAPFNLGYLQTENYEKAFWVKGVFPNLKDNILCFWVNSCDISSSNDGNIIKQMIFERHTLRSGDLIICATLAYNFRRKACQNKMIGTLNPDSLSNPSPSFCFWTMTSLVAFNLSFTPLSPAKPSIQLWKWGNTGRGRWMSKVSSLL